MVTKPKQTKASKTGPKPPPKASSKKAAANVAARELLMADAAKKADNKARYNYSKAPPAVKEQIAKEKAAGLGWLKYWDKLAVMNPKDADWESLVVSVGKKRTISEGTMILQI